MNATGFPALKRCQVSGSRARQTAAPALWYQTLLNPCRFKAISFATCGTFFNGSVIPSTGTKGFFKNLHVDFAGIPFDFGSGGLHASVSSRNFHADDDYAIIDIDVASFYPNIAIVNRWFPAHLSEVFCDIYNGLYVRRKQYAKGTSPNAMFKLALNGVYGDSNNKHSPFYDPAYTMAVTINGQLHLAWLAELVMQTPQTELIQVNTDGLTVRIHRSQIDLFRDFYHYWEECTGLELEEAQYESMWIRDVNNYVAKDLKGKVKRKGAYALETALENPFTGEVQWHKDNSSLVVQKAVDANLTRSKDVMAFIYEHKDPWDFMCHLKVGRKSRLYCGSGANPKHKPLLYGL